jgi:hypothetical protein
MSSINIGQGAKGTGSHSCKYIAHTGMRSPRSSSRYPMGRQTLTMHVASLGHVEPRAHEAGLQKLKAGVSKRQGKPVT